MERSMQYGQSTNNDASTDRCATELETIRDKMHGSIKATVESNGLLREIIIKLRGQTEPDAHGKQVPVAVPSGILGQLNEGQSNLAREQAETYELITVLQNLI